MERLKERLQHSDPRVREIVILKDSSTIKIRTFLSKISCIIESFNLGFASLFLTFI